jgi:hypothetical protein
MLFKTGNILAFAVAAMAAATGITRSAPVSSELEQNMALAGLTNMDSVDFGLLLANTSMIDIATASLSTTIRPRADLRRGQFCGYQWMFLMDWVIVNAHPNMWKKRYNGDADKACEAWNSANKNQNMCGYMHEECLIRDKWDEKDWLYLQAHTCVGNDKNGFVNALRDAFDVGTMPPNTDFGCQPGWA